MSASSKKTAKPQSINTHLEYCNFDATQAPEQVAALTALANALVEQAKAAQAIAAALKGSDAPLLKIGGAA